MRILITGIAGAGKSSVINELGRRGHKTVDLDTAGVCAWVSRATGEEARYVAGAGEEWIAEHRWQVIAPKLIELLATFPDTETVFVGGKISTSQLKEMQSVFHKIFLLQPDDRVVDERLATRTSNVDNFAKTPEERQHILSNRHDFEAACLAMGATPLKNHGSVEELVSDIENVANKEKR